jgi:hypothetical protein
LSDSSIQICIWEKRLELAISPKWKVKEEDKDDTSDGEDEKERKEKRTRRYSSNVLNLKEIIPDDNT